MNALDLLAEFARRADIAGLAFNEKGLARLQVDGEVTIDLEHDPAAHELHLYCSFGNAPAEDREPFYERLLGFNLFCRRTRGGTLAIDRGTGEVLLCRVLQLDGIDYVGFESALTQLVEAAETLGPELANTAGAAPSRVVDDQLPAWSIRV